MPSPRTPARTREPKPPVERDLAVRMFEVMALMRAVEDRMVTMYRQGELLGSLYTGHWHEAIAVGTASALRPTDVIAPLHRDLGVHLWRGLEPWQVMASFMGKATSPTGGRDGTLHYGRLDLNIINPVSHIPNNYPVATGAAFALRYRGTDGVAMAYCGDGATSRGDFHEALNIAGVQRLPCVFIVENNQYAYSTPNRRLRQQGSRLRDARRAGGRHRCVRGAPGRLPRRRARPRRGWAIAHRGGHDAHARSRRA